MKRETVQTAVRLPREMHDRLKEDEGGVSEQIRQRVERTFADDTIDQWTRELLSSIKKFASEAELEAGNAWHNHAGAYEVFRLAIIKRLARLKPEGPANFGDRTETVLRKLMQTDDPDAIAGMIEYTDFRMLDPVARERVRSAMEQNEREMLESQQRQAKGKKP